MLTSIIKPHHYMGIQYSTANLTEQVGYVWSVSITTLTIHMRRSGWCLTESAAQRHGEKAIQSCIREYERIEYGSG